VKAMLKIVHQGIQDRDIIDTLINLASVCTPHPERHQVLTSVLCVCQELALFGPITARSRLSNLVPIVLSVLEHSGFEHEPNESAGIQQCVMEFIGLVPRIDLDELAGARRTIFRGSVPPGLISNHTLAQINDDRLTRVESLHQKHLPKHLQKAKQHVVNDILETLTNLGSEGEVNARDRGYAAGSRLEKQASQKGQESGGIQTGDGEYEIGGTLDWTERAYLQLRVNKMWQKKVGNKLEFQSVPDNTLDNVIGASVQQRRDKWANLKALAVHGELKKHDMTESRVNALQTAGIPAESLACALSKVEVEDGPSATRKFMHADPYSTVIRSWGIMDDVHKRNQYNSLSRLALAGHANITDL
jgi:hypothetical protein